jgi:toxin CcdB
MAQFDVYENPNSESKEIYPFLLNVQADLLDVLDTTVVVPMCLLETLKKPARHLNPVFTVKDEKFCMLTQQISGISNKNLGQKVASLSSSRSEILASLDFLITAV